MLTQHQNKIFPLENLTCHFINTNIRGISPSLRALNFSPVFPPLHSRSHLKTPILPHHGRGHPQGTLPGPPLRPEHFLTNLIPAVEQQSCLPGHAFVFLFSLAFGGKTQPRALTSFVSLLQQRQHNARPSTGGVPGPIVQLFQVPPMPLKWH